jgi:hypothetical protein
MRPFLVVRLASVDAYILHIQMYVRTYLTYITDYYVGEGSPH